MFRSAVLRRSVLAVLLVPHPGAGDVASVAGSWHGTLTPPGTSVKIYVDLDAGENGTLDGRLTIPALGIRDQTLADVAIVGDAFTARIPEAPGDARFEGIVSEGSTRISGLYHQAGQSFPFELVRGEGERERGEFVPGTEAELIGRVAHEIEARYLYPERGREIADLLRESFEDGYLNGVTDGRELARLTTERLIASSGDLHLRLLYHLEEGEEDHEHRAARTGPDSSFGFRRIEILDGNVGYIELYGFSGDETSAARADAAMAFLADVDALILDLRPNLGGSPFMVRYLSSYLFAGPTHLVSTRFRDRESPLERWTFETIGGSPRPDLPLYVLTSETTVSAAESFLFGLRNHGRVAAVVGERTAGGGHMAQPVYLGNGFTVTVPFAMTFNPKTGQGWEGSGLEPDVPVDADEALTVALALIRSDAAQESAANASALVD